MTWHCETRRRYGQSKSWTQSSLIEEQLNQKKKNWKLREEYHQKNTDQGIFSKYGDAAIRMKEFITSNKENLAEFVTFYKKL